MSRRNNRKRVYSMTLYVLSWVGFALTFPAWLFGWIDDRAMLGITLALSWFALILESRNGVHIDS